MEVEGGSLVQDHPLMYSKFEASLGYRRPCLKNRQKQKTKTKPKQTKNPIDSSWPEITLESGNCPNSMASIIYEALPVAELRSPLQLQPVKSLSLCAVLTVASGCLSQGLRERSRGLCQYLSSENLLGTPLLT